MQILFMKLFLLLLLLEDNENNLLKFIKVVLSSCPIHSLVC